MESFLCWIEICDQFGEGDLGACDQYAVFGGKCVDIEEKIWIHQQLTPCREWGSTVNKFIL